jgi:hypothetical protein
MSKMKFLSAPILFLSFCFASYSLYADPLKDLLKNMQKNVQQAQQNQQAQPTAPQSNSVQQIEICIKN